MLRGVLFDLDGVLVNSEPVAFLATKKAFKDVGVTITKEDVLPFIGAGAEAYVHGLIVKYHVPVKHQGIVLEKREKYYVEMACDVQGWDVKERLLRLKKNGLKIALATSARRKPRAEELLKRASLKIGDFDAAVTGEEVVKKKPSPDIFLKAAERLHLKPEECIVIEDSVNGMMAAKNAGMRCIAVLTTFSKKELKEAQLHCKDVTVALDLILKGEVA